jgi:hypothetical protein
VEESRYHLRCSEDDRILVEEVLSQAFQAGRIDQSEFSDRLAQIHQAKSYSELLSVVRDIPNDLELDPHGDARLVVRSKLVPQASAEVLDHDQPRHFLTVALVAVAALLFLPAILEMMALMFFPFGFMARGLLAPLFWIGGAFLFVRVLKKRKMRRSSRQRNV